MAGLVLFLTPRHRGNRQARAARRPSGSYLPAARITLQSRRVQSKRFRCNAADPKLDAIDTDLDEDSIFLVRFGWEIGVVDPSRTHLGSVFAQRCRADQGDVRIVGFRGPSVSGRSVEALGQGQEQEPPGDEPGDRVRRN